MINVKPFFKWMTISLCGVALCYSLLQRPKAPPLPEPTAFERGIVHPVEFPVPALSDLIQQKLIIPLVPVGGAGSSEFDDQVLSSREEETFMRMNARRGEPLMTPEEFLQAIYTPSAIQPAPAPDLDRQPLVAGAGEIKEAVQFSREKLETLFIGDEMYMHSKTLGSRFIMVVDQVQDHQDGTITWQGHLKDLPRHYQVSFTQGPQFTLADIETPHGDYLLEAQGDAGWLIEKDDFETEPDFNDIRSIGYVARSSFMSSTIH